MARTTKTIPEGLRALNTQLVVQEAEKLIAFCQKAFGAELLHKMPGPDGKGVIHAALRFGDVAVMVSQPGFAQPTSSNLFLYVPDVDAVYQQAVAAGAKPLAPVADMFWGDRWGLVADPFGNAWQIATHKEDVAPEEMMKRMRAAGPPR